MNGVEIAAIITAALGGLAGLGAFIKTLVDSRNSAKRGDLQRLEDTIEVQHKSDLAIINNLQSSIDYQGKQIMSLVKENNTLHDTDNALRLENGQLRTELESVRCDNRTLQDKVDEQSRQITELQKENAALRTKNTQLEVLTAKLGEKLDAYRAGKKPTGSLNATAGLD